MIELYTGTPGSGKSLDAACEIRAALKSGKPVVANFEVVKDESWSGDFTYMPNSGVTVGNLVNISRDYWAGREFKENGILLVLDECQLLFNSRRWNQDSNRMEFLEFMSQHRKYGYRIILVCQADIMIDRQFRSLVEYECNHRKISNYGILGMIVKLFAFGELFYCCESLYAAKLKTGGRFFRYSKKLGAMYDSYSKFQNPAGAAVAAPAALEAGIMPNTTKSYFD